MMRASWREEWLPPANHREIEPSCFGQDRNAKLLHRELMFVFLPGIQNNNLDFRGSLLYHADKTGSILLQYREGLVMHGNNLFRLDHFHGMSGLNRVHGKTTADGKKRDVNIIYHAGDTGIFSFMLLNMPVSPA